MPSLSDWKTKAAFTQGRLNDSDADILLDSGASCSVIHKNYVLPSSIRPLNSIRLTNADGTGLTSMGTSTVKVQLDSFITSHAFIVVEQLSAPAIIGCDFLRQHGVVIDFGKGTFRSLELSGVLKGKATTSCMLVLDDDCPQAIPHNAHHTEFDIPTDCHPALNKILEEYRTLFKTSLGLTNATEHVIDTGDSPPVKVPARQIPFHYKDRVQDQLQAMARDGIIRPSNSPWSAPAVYVPKQNGEIRICVDYVQLNKSTKKDSYPVPRTEGPQQKLANKCVFSKLDLRSAYWQFPMSENSIEKTAFSPGPGHGLWEFTRMPYGLTGAAQTCQRCLDEVLVDCKDCVDNYVDDCIVFSDNLERHCTDLRRVFSKISEAGFTLRGSKCFFGKYKVDHLGFEYSGEGIRPTAEKTRAVRDWPTPMTVKDVRSFLGLVNFYRRFIPHFSDIAAPLNELTQRETSFSWQEQHQKAFESLKQALVSSPILDYPRQNDKFVLTTDASDTGLGAVLSTERGTVIEYASRTLTSAEKNYATTEKECLAIVWSVHKLRQYLIGSRFKLETDHKPLEWLESARTSQARSQRLERWSLELRAFEFDVVYRPGTMNQSADALSRKPIMLVGLHSPWQMSDLVQAQKQDPLLRRVVEVLERKAIPPTTGEWQRFPLKRYKQLWSQLILHNGLLCRKMKSPTMTEEHLLVVFPKSLQRDLLKDTHDESGHQGVERTMARTSQIAYWVGMGRDISYYCSQCIKCQTTKPPLNRPAPLQPVIACRPWEMVAVDILKVLPSHTGNQYLLVAQDYFSKWPFAKGLPDQKAETIVQVLKDDIFSLVGPPQKLHSDQGRNFESRVLGDLCRAFGVKKSHTTPYHPMGDGLVERMNRSILTLLRTYIDKEEDWEKHLQLLLFCYRTTTHSSTGLSPYEVLFGFNPPFPFQVTPALPSTVIPEPSEYSEHLKSKLLQIREMVEASIVESAEHQRQFYHGSETHRKLTVGQEVLLNNPTRGKLGPKWTGPWTVTGLKGSLTVSLKMGVSERSVHINRVRPLVQPARHDMGTETLSSWEPPLFQHGEDIEDEPVDHPVIHEEGENPPLDEAGGEDQPNDDTRQEDMARHPMGHNDFLVTTRSGRVVKPVQRYQGI